MTTFKLTANPLIAICDGVEVRTDMPLYLQWLADGGVAEPRLNTLAEYQIDKVAQVTDLQTAKLFSNFDATFPSGVKTIQIRNDADRMNIMLVMLRAMSLPAETEITFKTLDNVTQTLTAAQFIVIGQAVMAAKEAIKAQGDVHDAAIRACATIAEVQAYDITTGW